MSTTAFPPRTTSLADMLQLSLNTNGILLYFKAWLLILVQTLDENPALSAAEWIDAQLGSSGSDIDKRVQRQWRLLYVNIDKNEQPLDETLIADVLEDVTKHVSGMARVVFVFDEAMGLYLPHRDTFHKLLKALAAFMHHRTFFAVMVDTDASLLEDLEPLPLWDLCRTAIGSCLKMPVPGESLKHYADPLVWMQYGRPLWSARLQSGGDNLETLLACASECLTPPGCIREPAAALALLSATVGLNICPRSRLARVMAASHMHLTLSVSTLGEQKIHVGLPVEPILAEAAASRMNEETRMQALKAMELAYMAGDVIPHPRGEFVAKFILLAATWGVEDPLHLHLLSLDDYLERLLVTSARCKPTLRNMKRMRASTWNDVPRSAYVFFNSYVRVDKVVLDAAVLSRCFAAAKAIMYYAENELVPGADLIIPVWTPSGMTAIVVILRSLARPGWLESVAMSRIKGELTEIDVKGLPVFTLIMSLREPTCTGAGAGECKWILRDESPDANDSLQVHLTCYGIQNNFGFLSGAVKNQLRRILSAECDALSGATGEQLEWSRRMMPPAGCISH